MPTRGYITRIIPAVYALGIYHYSIQSLAVGDGYSIFLEPDNPPDSKAILCNERGDKANKRAYLRHKDASRVFDVLNANLHHGEVLLRCKEAPSVRSKGDGPRELHNLGFRVKNKLHPDIENLLKSVGLL